MPNGYTSSGNANAHALRQGLGYVPPRAASGSSGGGIAVTPGPSGQVISLEPTAVTPGTYGDATNVGQFTVDQDGRLTAASNVPITFPASGVTSFNTRTGAVVLLSADVTGALGFTPYNATNPAAYISGITSGMVTTALGYTPYNATNPAGYITSASLPVGANPSATISGSAVNGVAPTFMRSDAAPALANTAVTPGSYTNMSGTVDAQGRLTAASSGAATPSAANPSASVGLAAVNGAAPTFMRSDGAPALSQAIVPTWSNLHTFQGRLVLSGNLSAAAWTTAGLDPVISARTLTDTSSSGTVATMYAGVIAAPTFAASSVTTYTNTATLSIDEPVAGSNVTLTRKYALRLGGALYIDPVSGSGIIRTSNFNSMQLYTSTSLAADITPTQASFGSILGLSSSSAPGSPNVRLTATAAATFQWGQGDAASPISQTMGVQGSRTGTDSNVAGGNFTIKSGKGTGNAAGSVLNLQSAIPIASGTGAQTFTTGLQIYLGVAITPPLTVATLPTAAAALKGARSFVTDGSTTVILGLGLTVVGGGANNVPVYCDGTNWIVG